MTWYISAAVQLVKAYRQISEGKWSFLGFVALVFVASVATLAHYDLLPQAPVAPTISLTELPVTAASSTAAIIEEPMTIEIPKITLAATIANPTTTNIETLDEYLLKGAVRYPTSAKLGETGNVVLFGHSSYLPVVGNQAYKTFNGIQKLVAGDIVIIRSAGTAYTYRVRNMMKENADNAGIDLSVSGRVLTIATCNSFGTKSDRFVVTADFVESHSVSTQG